MGRRGVKKRFEKFKEKGEFFEQEKRKDGNVKRKSSPTRRGANGRIRVLNVKRRGSVGEELKKRRLAKIENLG